jgi:lipid-binding SYLF domain-containing protein
LNDNQHRRINGRVAARFFVIALGLAVLSSGCATPPTSRELDSDATAALRLLYAQNPETGYFDSRAKAVLIFPDIVKGGLVIGGQHGDGVLRMNGKTIRYYNIVTASYGLQAGLQRYSLVLFLMTDNALVYLMNSHGWDIGTGPSFVFQDVGIARSHTTTTLRKDVFAFCFDQEGFMAGLGLQGSKITQIALQP